MCVHTVEDTYIKRGFERKPMAKTFNKIFRFQGSTGFLCQSQTANGTLFSYLLHCSFLKDPNCNHSRLTGAGQGQDMQGRANPICPFKFILPC